MRTLKAIVGLSLTPVLFPFVAATVLFPTDEVYREWRAGFFHAVRCDVRALTGL